MRSRRCRSIPAFSRSAFAGFRFPPEIIVLCRHSVGDRWFMDETYVKVAGKWRYVYRAVDQYGQIIDVYVSARRDTHATEPFFTTALAAHGAPTEIVTDRAPALGTAVGSVDS